MIAATEAALAGQAPLLEARRAAGLARRCHGDLHLGNILQEGDAATLFDCIEFNDALSDIDVLYDLAFLLMDLAFRGQGDGAVRVLCGYLDQAARDQDDSLWRGLAALPLFLSVRAGVRAHVSAQMGDPAQARAYLRAALEHLSPTPARLVAIGGLSGSGKSTAARALAPRVGAAPGAVILRSDEVRKRLWRTGPRDRLAPDAYGPGTSQAVYGAMLEAAELALRAGRTVILDAVFLRPAERAAASALAARCGAPFDGLWLEAPIEILRARVDARRDDASDADARVVLAQSAQDPGVIDWTRLDAATDVAGAVASIR